MDLSTLIGWIDRLGYEIVARGERSITVRPRGAADELPPFVVQASQNWVLLSILPVFRPGEILPDDLPHRLLAVNRDMRIAKFAFDADDEVVLCAELPTESLQIEELADAVTRLVEYYRYYRGYLLDTGVVSTG